MRKYITTACLVSFFCTTHADTVINVDSDTQLASINAAQFYHYKVDGVNNLYALSNPIDMTSPTITKGYNGYNAPDVYAGGSRNSQAGQNIGMANSGGSGYRIRLNNATTAGTKIEVLNMFLTGEGAYTVTLNTENDTLLASGRNSTPASVTSDTYRFVLLEDGNWYASDPADVSADQNWSATIEATEVLWYSFDPTVAYTENGVPDIGETPVTPQFSNVSAMGTLHALVAAGGQGNFGMKKFSATASINGEVAAWAPTNSINWSNADYDGAAVTQGGNKGFDFSTASHYANEDMGTGGPTIYGAAYSPEAAYIYADSAQTNSTGTFDYRFSKNNNGGLGMRVGRPAGGIVSGTNINSGVISAYTLHMFPVTGLTENDADITLQTWSNQGAGGVNMTDGEIRFVVAKNYAGSTNWAISSPVEHSVGTTQYKTVNTAVTFQGLDWFNYNPANAWSIDNVGSQVLAPYPGDALAVGFRLYAGGVSETNNTAFVFGARSFTYSEREWNEYDNDNLVVDMDAVSDTPNEGPGGIQWEFRDIAYDETTPLVVSNSVLGDNEVTNFWNGAPVYVGFKMDGVYPAWDENIDYVTNTESNFNSAAFSVARNAGAGGLKIQWNGPQLTPGSATGTSPELEYTNGRFAAGDKATALLIWKSDEFLGGAAGSTYEMTAANDVLRANIILSQGNGTGDEQLLESGKIRFIVKEGGSYYISHASIITNMTTAEVIKQGTSTSWFNYDPSSLDTVNTSGEAVVPALTDIEAFGVWMQATVATNTGYRKYPRFGLADFSAGAIVNTPNAASIKQAWFDLYSGVMGAATADSDDPDGDGVANIIEYAFGGDPTDANSEGNKPTHGTVVNDSDEEMFEYIYFERSDAAARGLSSSIKESDNLVFTDFAAPESSYEVGRGVSVHSGFDAVTNHVPMTDAIKFIRIDVNYSE